MKELNDGRISTFKQIERIPFAENESEKKGEMDLVAFFFDSFIGEDIERVRKILQDIDDPNLITEIMDYLSLNTDANKNRSKGSYKSLFPSLKEQFIKDLEIIGAKSKFHARQYLDIIRPLHICSNVPNYFTDE